MSTYALKRWAREVMADGRLPWRPAAMRWDTPQVAETVLYRDGQRQLEMIVALPGVVVPRHRHNAVESFELILAGSLRVAIGDRVSRFAAPDITVDLGRQLTPIARGQWHGGEIFEQGAIFLSAQEWIGRPPGYISEDWEPWTAR